MPTYDSYLCTINHAKIQGGIPLAQLSVTTEDSLWLDMIGQMSTWASQLCGVSFEPRLTTATRTPSNNNLSADGRVLYLKARLLAVTSITLADGLVLLSDQYVLQPIGGIAPYTSILLTQASGLGWTQADDPQAKITLVGTWGQRSNYALSWTSITTLNGGINASVTSVVVVTVTGLHVGGLIRIGTEYLRITAIDTLTLTVVRGVNGTTAAAHTTGDALYLYQPDFAVMDAVARGAAWLKKRLGSFEEVKWSQESGLLQIIKNQLPDDVTGRLAPYTTANAVAESEFSTP